VSAPGRRYAGDAKVTDLLIAAHAAASVSLEQFDAAFAPIVARFSEIHSNSGGGSSSSSSPSTELTPALLTALDVTASSIYDKASPEAHATSCGEYLSALVMSEMLPDNYSFVDASELVLFDPHTHNLDFEQTMKAMRRRFVRDAKPDEGFVVPGFYGSEVGNRAATVTFSRGGSDVTASLVAAALAGAPHRGHEKHREHYERDDAIEGGDDNLDRGDFVYYHENFTDVDGIYTCDPFITPAAERIPRLSFPQIEAMSRAGSRVLHPFAIEPLKRVASAVPLHVRSTVQVAGNGGDDGGINEHRGGQKNPRHIRGGGGDGTWVMPATAPVNPSAGVEAGGLSTAAAPPETCRPLAVAGLDDRVTVVCNVPFPMGMIDNKGGVAESGERQKERLLEEMAAALDKSGIPLAPRDGDGRGRGSEGSVHTTTAYDESMSACIRIQDASQLDDALRAVFAEVNVRRRGGVL
jgi:hypothetical protein